LSVLIAWDFCNVSSAEAGLNGNVARVGNAVEEWAADSTGREYVLNMDISTSIVGSDDSGG